MDGTPETGNRVCHSALSAGETSRSTVSPADQITVTSIVPSEDVQPRMRSFENAELESTEPLEKSGSTDCMLAIEASPRDGAEPQDEKWAADTVAGAPAKRFFQSSSSLGQQNETSASFQFAAGPAYAPGQFSGVQPKTLVPAVEQLYSEVDLSPPHRLQPQLIRSSHFAKLIGSDEQRAPELAERQELSSLAQFHEGPDPEPQDAFLPSSLQRAENSCELNENRVPLPIQPQSLAPLENHQMILGNNHADRNAKQKKPSGEHIQSHQLRHSQRTMRQSAARHNSVSSGRSNGEKANMFYRRQGFNRPAIDDHGRPDVMTDSGGSLRRDDKRVAPFGDLSLPGSRSRRRQKTSHRSRRSDRVPTSEGSNISRPRSRLPMSDATWLPDSHRFSQRIADALNEWQGQTSDLSGEVEALSDLLRQKEQSLTRLREQHELGGQALEEAATKNANLSKTNQTLEEQINHSHAEQQQLHEQLTKSNNRLTCVTTDFQQVSLDLEKARTELRKHYHFKSHFNRLLGEFRSFGSETRAKWGELLDTDPRKRRTSEDEFNTRAAIEKAESVRDGLRKLLEENRSMVDQQEKTVAVEVRELAAKLQEAERQIQENKIQQIASKQCTESSEAQWRIMNEIKSDTEHIIATAEQQVRTETMGDIRNEEKSNARSANAITELTERRLEEIIRKVLSSASTFQGNGKEVESIKKMLGEASDTIRSEFRRTIQVQSHLPNMMDHHLEENFQVQLKTICSAHEGRETEMRRALMMAAAEKSRVVCLNTDLEKQLAGRNNSLAEKGEETDRLQKELARMGELLAQRDATHALEVEKLEEDISQKDSQISGLREEASKLEMRSKCEVNGMSLELQQVRLELQLKCDQLQVSQDTMESMRRQKESQYDRVLHALEQKLTDMTKACRIAAQKLEEVTRRPSSFLAQKSDVDHAQSASQPNKSDLDADLMQGPEKNEKREIAKRTAASLSSDFVTEFKDAVQRITLKEMDLCHLQQNVTKLEKNATGMEQMRADFQDLVEMQQTLYMCCNDCFDEAAPYRDGDKEHLGRASHESTGITGYAPREQPSSLVREGRHVGIWSRGAHKRGLIQGHGENTMCGGNAGPKAEMEGAGKQIVFRTPSVYGTEPEAGMISHSEEMLQRRLNVPGRSILRQSTHTDMALLAQGKVAQEYKMESSSAHEAERGNFSVDGMIVPSSMVGEAAISSIKTGLIGPQDGLLGATHCELVLSPTPPVRNSRKRSNPFGETAG